MDKENKEKLIEYYSKNIEKIDMPEPMRPLLVEVLLRRAMEFSLSTEDIKQDVTSLLNNLKTIEIGKMPKGFSTAAGVYMGNEKKIRIAPAYLKQAIKTGDFETLYEIFTHEVYHALCVDPNGHDRLVSFNKYSSQYNASLREAIVEKAADRCVFSRNTQESTAPYFHQNKFGYSDITFITDAIEATYGVTEKAFLRHAIMGRDRMVDFLSGVSDEKPEKSSDFLDRIEMNYTRLHGALYGQKRQTGKELENTLIDTLSSIYMICENQMQEVMEIHEVKDFDEAQRYLGNLKFAHNKLLNSMEHAINRFGYVVNAKQLKEKIEERILSTREATTSRISDFSQVFDNKDKLETQDEAIMLMRWSRYGNLGNYDQDKLSSAGIAFEKPKMFDISDSDRDSFLQMDFSRLWNNQDVIMHTNIFAQEEMKSIPRKVKDFFTQVTTRIKGAFSGQKKIGPSESNVSNSSLETYDVFRELTGEELEKFNQGVQSVLKAYHSKDEETKGVHKPQEEIDQTK